MSRSLQIDFSTCPSPKGDDAVRAIIEDSVEWIVDALGQRALLSIVLTGAMTQGEGTVLERADGTRTVLSDIDLYLVARPEEDSDRLKGLASKLARDLRRRFPRERIASSFDVAAVGLEEISALRPCIGTVDLRNRGRVIWGTNVLEELPPLDPSLVPPRDAVTLILNRVSEELMYRRTGSLAAADMGIYHSTKTGADLALAILVLLGEYRSTYRARAAHFDAVWHDPRLSRLRERAPDLPGKVARWTEQKLSPDYAGLAREVGGGTPEEVAERLWLSLVPTVEAVWVWAMEVWRGERRDRVADPVEAIGGMESPREKLRGWKQAWTRGDVGWNPAGLLRAGRGALRGSPLSLLYACILLVYFSAPGRNGLADAGGAGKENLERARRLMPVAPPAGGDWDDLRRALVDYWRATVMRGMR